MEAQVRLSCGARAGSRVTIAVALVNAIDDDEEMVAVDDNDGDDDSDDDDDEELARRDRLSHIIFVYHKQGFGLSFAARSWRQSPDRVVPNPVRSFKACSQIGNLTPFANIK